MNTSQAYDGIIIASGQAGIPLATTLAQAGMRTILIEREDIGGTCVEARHLVARARARSSCCSSGVMVDQTKLTLSEESGQDMKYPNKLLKHLEESQMKSLPRPKSGFVVTHFLTVSNIERSTHFYRDILGGEVLLAGEPTYVALANTYIVLNVGGGPTDDKPNVTLRPPTSSTEASSFLNIRVSDIQHFYQEWKGKGAEFLTEPKNHKSEFRCYMKDPDEYLIEVGQTKAEAFKNA